MTSDAKIGLLLGLVFIFIIAFIIKGLPTFRHSANNNELTIVGGRNNPPAFGAREREVINRTEQIAKQPPAQTQISATNEQDTRYAAPLPQSTLAVEEINVVESAAPVQPPPADKEGKNLEVEPTSVEPGKPGLPKFYVVSEGDSLASIARKFYGGEEGNKRVNIERIFKVNQKVLKSFDEIYPGQKLVIPPLTAYQEDKKTDKGIFSGKIFKKVESIGQRHLSADGRQAKKQDRFYVVREDDTLWRIAAEQLGSGYRYTEIARINADVLEDQDNLPVGLRLKLPSQ